MLERYPKLSSLVLGWRCSVLTQCRYITLYPLLNVILSLYYCQVSQDNAKKLKSCAKKVHNYTGNPYETVQKRQSYFAWTCGPMGRFPHPFINWSGLSASIDRLLVVYTECEQKYINVETLKFSNSEKPRSLHHGFRPSTLRSSVGLPLCEQLLHQIRLTTDKGPTTKDEMHLFCDQAYRYSRVFRQDCPFRIENTTQFNPSTPEARIIASRDIEAGETIQYLDGVCVKLEHAERSNFEYSSRDFSIVDDNYLLIGPVRFVNHEPLY